MTFEEFLNKVDEIFMKYQASKSSGSQWRYGQTVMNVLYDVWPEKYSEITGSDIDCFYSNSTVQYTLDKLEKEWILK